MEYIYAAHRQHHRNLKSYPLSPELTASKPMNHVEFVNKAGLDIFGNDPSQTALTDMCACPNCKRRLPTPRFAHHMEKCLGVGGRQASMRQSGRSTATATSSSAVNPTTISNVKKRKNLPTTTATSDTINSRNSVTDGSITVVNEVDFDRHVVLGDISDVETGGEEDSAEEFHSTRGGVSTDNYSEEEEDNYVDEDDEDYVVGTSSARNRRKPRSRPRGTKKQRR